MKLDSVIRRLDGLAKTRGVDYGLRLEIANECCWSAELRITPNPNRPDGPDRSYVSYAVGGDTPDTIASKAFRDLMTWLPEAP